MTDNVKLFLTCLLLSYIVGAFTIVTINKDRTECTVQIRDGGGNTHVFTGRTYR